MKNLKKVLALVLAFACAFTMFAGAASFTDQADIKAVDAVAKLSALGVINGNPDGSFKPEGTVTRAEMAKMIYVVRNGGNDNADSYKNIATKFTDVNGHWAAGFIKYCEAQKIIAGKSATIFDPDGLVTGTEAAKMLLVTAGYQADKAGLIGTGWDQKTLALASEAGLLDDMGATNLAAGLPRQYAAQIISNALDTDTVVWSADTSSFEKKETNVLELRPTGADSSQWVNVVKNETVGQKYMKLSTSSAGILTAVNKEDAKDTFTVTINGTDFKKVEADYSDLMGQNVKVMLKDNDTSKVYGIYADDDSKVVASGYVGALELDGTEKVKLNGTSYKLDSADNTGKIVMTANTDEAMMGFNTLAAEVVKGSVDKNYAASSIKLIDNDGDGKVDAAVYSPVKVGKVTAVSKSSITVNNGINTVKFDDATIYDGVAKDDYVAFTSEDNLSADKDLVVKLDVTSQKVSGTRTGEIKVDNTWVKLASSLTDVPTSGNTYDMVIVGGVVLFSDETAAASKDVLYVSGVKDFDAYVGETNGTKEVRAYFTDASNKTVKVSKLDGEKLTTSNEASVAAAKMYTYSVLSDGTYDIKALSDSNRAGYDSVVSGTTDGYADQKIDGESPTDDAVVFVQTGKETKVLTGKQVKNWSDSALTTTSFAYALKEKNGINYVALAALVSAADSSVPGATKDTMYAYLTSDGYKADKDGEDKATYEVWTSNGAETLYADTASVVSNAVAGAVISYNVNGSYIENIKVNANIEKAFSEVAITGFDYKAKGELAFVAGAAVNSLIAKGANQITLDEDCVFIGIKDEDTAGVEGATMDQIQLANAGKNSTSDAETVLTNAYVVVGGDDDKVIAVIFDADSNELDAAKELVKTSGDLFSE